MNFYEAVVNNSLDLGAPIIDAMAADRIVKTNYDGDHYQGKDGNIWDHLVDNNNNNGGSNNSGGNTGSGDSGSTDQSGSSSNSNGQDTQVEEEKLIAKVTETKIITEEEPAMTDTVKYLIVFLAVLSVALVFVIGYVAMRMCTKRRMKPMNYGRRASQPKNEFQYAGDDTKDIFNDRNRRRRKVNDADERQEASLDVNRQGSNNNLRLPQTPVQDNGMTTEGHYAETDRELATTSHK